MSYEFVWWNGSSFDFKTFYMFFSPQKTHKKNKRSKGF